MKVYSLYHHNKFVASFPSREESVAYGKECGGDPWDYDIIEEYLNKTPYQMYIPNPLSNTIPCVSPNSTKIVHNSHPNDPKPYFDAYGGVKADD